MYLPCCLINSLLKLMDLYRSIPFQLKVLRTGNTSQLTTMLFFADLRVSSLLLFPPDDQSM